MIFGKGSETETLNEAQVHDLCAEAFSQKNLDDKRVLVILPDYTRSGPIDMMFRVVYQVLAERVKALDFLIALGTHPSMSEDALVFRRMSIRIRTRKLISLTMMLLIPIN